MDDEERKVYVGNLHHTVQIDYLKSLFSQFGKLQNFYLSPGYPCKYATNRLIDAVRCTITGHFDGFRTI